jgi:hypothetical protein
LKELLLKGGDDMTKRMTSLPEQPSVTCVQLPSREAELVPDETMNISGGCLLPGEDPLEHLADIVDDIYDLVSEWWG